MYRCARIASTKGSSCFVVLWWSWWWSCYSYPVVVAVVDVCVSLRHHSCSPCSSCCRWLLPATSTGSFLVDIYNSSMVRVTYYEIHFMSSHSQNLGTHPTGKLLNMEEDDLPLPYASILILSMVTLHLSPIPNSCTDRYIIKKCPSICIILLWKSYSSF